MTTPLPNASATFLDIQLALSQIGDVEAMNGMLVMLQDTLSQDIPLIDDYLRSGDVVRANSLLHALKGFIPIFSSPDLCAHVVRVEALSKDSQSKTVAPAFLELKPQLEQLLTEVRAHLLTVAS
jgi:HPt (histidine-containing phosphotransfer) domain-containing protein